MQNRPQPLSLSGTSRGNPLSSYRIDRAGSTHVLRLRGPSQIADQVVMLAPEYSRVGHTTVADESWPHTLTAPGNVRQAVVGLLDACRWVVALPCPGLVAFALDWYKMPQDGVESHDWPNTTVGEFVSLGKYKYQHDPELQRPLGRQLTSWLHETVRAHPLLVRVQVVVDVPGHDRKRVSFGSQLSASVAHRLNLPFAKTTTRSAFRPQAKDAPAGERSALLQDEFSADPAVRGRHVLIVDDVYRSGVSVQSVAAAARAAGARSLSALCAARTLRG